ncbi:MAG: outer membrane beta-barrel protein [Deltaproteobacteria bacterium]|nr:outer membrane beta-barrel protein [Candidatus Anaeroferrophillacea bacterium]
MFRSRAAASTARPALTPGQGLKSALFLPALFILPLLLLPLLLLSAPRPAAAADFTWKPQLTARTEYDDNVTFSSEEHLEDIGLRLIPELDLKWAGERWRIATRADVNIYQYLDETDLNTVHQYYKVDGSWQARERLELHADADYRFDDTLEAELLETGLVNRREDRERTTFGGGFTWQATETWQAGGDYTFSKTMYDGEENTDYDTHSLVFTASRPLFEGRDRLFIQPYYTFFDADISEVDNYGLIVGWSHAFNPRWSCSLAGGVRYTSSDYETWRLELVQVGPDLYYPVYRRAWETDNNWGGVADISTRYIGERWSLELGYNRDISFGSSGETIERDQVTVSFTRRITERLHGSFRATVSASQSDSNFSSEDSTYLSLAPKLSYRLTENHSLDLGYEFAQATEDYDYTSADTYDRSRVWLSLVFRFPQY